MGRSKFPGKPSKLVTKKRVSVLNGIASSTLSEATNDLDTDESIVEQQQQQSNSTENDTSLRVPTPTNIEASIDVVQEKNDAQMNSSEKPQPPDPPDTANKEKNSNDLESIDAAATASVKKATKKKKVSFKFGLETSDDSHIVKKEPNASFAPPIPIIKKECLTRAIRIARGGESIIMPSRLTGLTQKFRNNSANNIDKLNSLTFKSQFVTTTKQNSDDYAEFSDTYSDDEDGGVNDQRNNGNSETDEENDEERKSNTNECAADDAENGEEHSDAEEVERKSSKSNKNGTETNGASNVNGKIAIGEKRFVLPKRSVHSCRVIKPNKRFVEESQAATKKNGIARKKTTNKSESMENIIAAKIEPESLPKAIDEMEDDTNEEDNGSALKLSDHIKNNPFAKIIDNSTFGMSTSKTILRQSRLQFASSLTPTSTTLSTNKDGLFSSNLNCSSINRNSMQLSNAVCGVCATVSPAAFTHQSRKYGISSCEACRKFISKTIKKLDVSGENSPLNVLQCRKNDGNCTIPPTVRSIRSYKASIKERCPACWLKKCVLSYRLPSELRTRIVATLPSSMRNLDNKTFTTTFHNKMDVIESNGSAGKSNLFTNSLNACRRMLPTWPKDVGSNNIDGEFRLFVALSNPLAENNVKFGSSPQIVPTISEKPTIMIPIATSSTNDTNNGKTVDTISEETKAQISPGISTAATTKKSATISIGAEVEETSRLRLRKKERSDIATTATTTTVAISSTVQSTATTTGDITKRQRIDLKGPRVKHVCRSASIVLGQPIATFPDDSPILDSLDTPPRPESPNGIIEFEPSTLIADKQNEQNKQFGFTDCADSTRMSPPATPIINEYDSESTKENAGDKSPDSSKTDESNSSGGDIIKNKSDESKPITRKLSRPNALLTSTNHSINNKKLNSFIRKPEKPIVKTAPVISTDFWENYDPAEVSQTGFGLILSEEVPLKALCFLCGSCGQEPLIFCACCCEPYHQYCVEDEYNLKHGSLEDTNASFMETTFIGGNALTASNYKLNWLCPRCTICYTCNMASGSKVKCQKCHKNYHSTCLGTSKRLLGADRPLICASCLKCKSCGTTNVSKFVGNLPMCSSCFKLRQKGNYCPLCQKCYEDNDFNIKMMECGDCHRWVHSKCEGLTDEQYNMLSVLPENIEFICKQCAKTNSMSDTWREAVSVEFKAGLMGVVKLLSKSRQACALLKLSPRKKPAGCRVCAQANFRSIPLRNENDFDDDSMANNELLPENTYQEKCYCSTTILSQKANTSQSLLDIKQKILSNKYFSLADFNYDMNIVINAASCNELMTTYKEILSESFPWFQNETKACTDALEEDMYDSCNFGQGASNDEEEMDQQVPMVDVPDDIDEYFYQPLVADDTRNCLFCKGTGDGLSSHESRLLYCGQNSWVHINCAMWSAEVFEEIDGSLQNVHSAISRGRLIKCSECGNKGATVGCNVRNCGEHYHFPCARNANCAFMIDKTVFCPQHSANVINESKSSTETNFEVQRPVYVELDRKRKRPVSPKNVQFLIGSLHVRQLGRFVAKLSDRKDAIVPADFLCSRLYWSSKEPWKIVEYTIRTSVQSNVNIAMDMGRNFTIDHSTNTNKVQIGMAQIAKWHSSLLNGDDYEHLLRQERSMKMLHSAINGHNEETNEEEPQSSADLLPPEIKDAIFEDLPHDILDGISMLDIFPKLEDMVAMDSKNEVYMSDGNTTDEELSQNSQKCFDTTNNWTNTNMHVEDAMLSARSTSALSRDLKRNKTEVFSRNGFSNRPPPQRATNLTWNNKIDSVKRRKMSRFDLRLPEGVLITLGRRKDEISTNISEITRQCLQSDETKNKTFTWSAANRFAQLNGDSQCQPSDNSSTTKSRFKISQLDGMDDISSGSERGSPNNDFGKFNIMNNYNSREAPVKCDRCHCTYRTQDSYARHLQTCEPLSTSESDSEATSKSPEIQNQSNMILTSLNAQDYCNIPILQQSNQNQQIFSLNGTNLNQLAMQNPVQIQPITSLQNGSIPVQMQSMFINPTTTMQQQQQQQVFTQPLTLNALQQSMFPMQNNQAQTISLQQATSQNIQYQPQIITCSTANTSQVLTMTPSQQQNISTSNYASIKTIQTQPFNKNPMILPQLDKNNTRKQPIAKIQMSPSRAPKGRGASNAKAIQMKKSNVIKTETTKTVTQITNQNMANIRPANTQLDNNIVIQPAATAQSQPIIMQQLAGANQGNILQYVTTSDGQNSMQYFAMPTPTNDFKQQTPTQYLTPNPMIPGTFQLQTDNGNLLVANTPTGLQVIPNGALQLAQSQQPQVIGTLIQPQATTIQCGMMSSEQMVLGGTPTFEMVTNQLPGCMLLNSQPVYYGLETIVQNTVMQSQQFVSTAMQGVLSQNSSFSATTTQVFQASKIEPIMEMQPSYVVLNNDGTIMQQQQQQPILSANLLQQALPQIQTQATQQMQSAQNPGWRFIDDKSMFTTNAGQTILQAQSQQMQTNQPQTISLQHSQQPPIAVTPQPIQPQKLIIQQKPPVKHRQPKQQALTQKHFNKPTIKSSPIIMAESQQQIKLSNNIGNFDNDIKPPVIYLPKPTTDAFIVPKSIESLTKTELVNSKTHLITTSSANETKISTKIMSPPSQPVQKKTNTSKMIGNGTKMTSATIKPKIVNKPSVKQPNMVTASTLASAMPTITMNSVPSLQTKKQLDQQKPIVMPLYQAANVSLPNSNNMNAMQSINDSKAPICAFDNGNLLPDDRESQTRKLLSGSSFNAKIGNNSTSTASQPNINNSQSSQYIHSQMQSTQPLIDSQKQMQSQYNLSNQTTTINLPTSNSIQLPTAPYAPLYANGIPTNVVNPIQQYNHNNTRPTNRVLPMQTIQQKNNSLTEIPIETKLEPKKIKQNRFSVSPTSTITSDIKNEEIIIKSDQVPEDTHSFVKNDKIDFKLEDDIDDISNNSDSDNTFKDSFMRSSTAEAAFDKLKNEETNSIMNNNSTEIQNSMDVSDVKEKISKIINNFEQEDDLDKNVMDSSNLFHQSDQPMTTIDEECCSTKENDDEMLDQKENHNPAIISVENVPAIKLQKTVKDSITQKSSGPKLLYEIQSQDGFTYKSTSITEIWEKVFEAVQIARKAHGLSPLPVGPLADMCGHQMMGLKTNALKYLLEQLPGVERCSNYKPVYHKRAESTLSQASSSGYWSDYEELKENKHGTARCERYKGRSEYDMFSWLASRHRKQPIQICLPQSIENEAIPRRGSGSNLPMAMRYRTLKETYKESVGVYRSHIHGRGLFCNRDIEAGEMVIEYAGELIRSTLTDKRERYYDGRGIGCYMFKIDDNLVVDATMRGNAARFINHSCEPNCYSKVVDILGHKHIIIFALRRIVQGEELTYDYKFPFEETKIPCSCGSRKCRKYLN